MTVILWWVSVPWLSHHQNQGFEIEGNKQQAISLDWKIGRAASSVKFIFPTFAIFSFNVHFFTEVVAALTFFSHLAWQLQVSAHLMTSEMSTSHRIWYFLSLTLTHTYMHRHTNTQTCFPDENINGLEGFTFDFLLSANWQVGLQHRLASRKQLVSHICLHTHTHARGWIFNNPLIGISPN